MRDLKSRILEVLKSVIDPDLNKNIVDLGFIKKLEITDNGDVSFQVELTTPACPIKAEFKRKCHDLVSSLEGVNSVEVEMTAKVQKSITNEESSLMSGVKNVIAVSSCKGGVGKSTVTTNLAMSLSLSGATVGVLDADIYGPSMMMMFDIKKGPEVGEDNTIYPVTVKGGIKVISMGMFANSDKATIWRGPMVSQMIKHFIKNVHWGELDYLLIDFPPGTGDIQLSLTQSCPISGAIVVTTPQNVSLLDVKKGLQMFDAVSVPVLGVVENMSYFICDSCNKKHYIFKKEGGVSIAKSLGLPFLGQVPIESLVTSSGDDGVPIVLSNPNSASAEAFMNISGKMVSRLAIQSIENKLLANVNYTYDEIPVYEGNEDLPLSPKKEDENQELFLKAIYKKDLNFVFEWNNDELSKVSFQKLRQSCACAVCVDEWSREQILDINSIAADIIPNKVTSLGRYAINIEWSDGHKSGIFTWDVLSKIS